MYMTYYLISYTVIDEGKIINGGIDAIKSKIPKALIEITSHFKKFYAGTGDLFVTSIQKISEEDFEHYGSYNEID